MAQRTRGGVDMTAAKEALTIAKKLRRIAENLAEEVSNG